MKSSTTLIALSGLQSVHAYYACTMADAVPIADVLAPLNTGTGGVTPGLVGGGGSSYIPIQSGGCSFLIAAGGECSTTYTPIKRATYDTLPCLDSMACAVADGALGCFDVSTLEYVADDGTCGSLATGEVKQGCVEELMKDAGWASSSANSGSSGGSSAALTATGTTSGLKATATSGSSTSQSSSAAVEQSQNAGAKVGSAAVLGLFGVVAAVAI